MDALEKASFQALHGAAQAQRMLYSHQPPLPSVTNGAHVPAAARSPHLPSASHSGEPTGRRKEAKRPSSGMPSPQRSPKAPKQPKPDRPPPPSDSELLHLPAGLCRRYQQGRCHKGRSCKWKHEVWAELQLRWEAWQNGHAMGCAPASASNATSAAAAAFPPPTTSGGTAQQQFKCAPAAHACTPRHGSAQFAWSQRPPTAGSVASPHGRAATPWKQPRTHLLPCRALLLLRCCAASVRRTCTTYTYMCMSVRRTCASRARRAWPWRRVVSLHQVARPALAQGGGRPARRDGPLRTRCQERP
jgi:hypothetical protein